MDKASQSVKTNRRGDGKKKGGFAAPPRPSGTKPTPFDDANKEELMNSLR